MKQTDVIYDKIRGALVGVAVGDAMGAPLEFMIAEKIKEIHGGEVTEMIGGGWLNLEPGEITDDTQMTMAVAHGITDDPKNPVGKIGTRFMEWYQGAPKDVGGTCAMAIAGAIDLNVTSKAGWTLVSRNVNRRRKGKTGGNGALMRTIYPAIFYHDEITREIMVREIAEMTHVNKTSSDICVEYSNAVHSAIFGGNPLGSITAEHYIPGAEPTGYVVDTWSNVIEAVLGTESFEEAIIEAINRGGDADTIGAITGGLAGAYYGYNAIPTRWIDHLDKELLFEIEDLASLAYSHLRSEIFPFAGSI